MNRGNTDRCSRDYRISPASSSTAVVRLIDVLWLYENAGPSPRSERVLPTGTVELVINLRDYAGRSFDGVVAGPHSRFFMLDSGQPVSVIGAHFKAGGAFPFFALLMDELRNQHVPLEILWGKEEAVELFIQLFSAEVGLTPKAFCRIKHACSDEYWRSQRRPRDGKAPCAAWMEIADFGGEESPKAPLSIGGGVARPDAAGAQLGDSVHRPGTFATRFDVDGHPQFG